MRLSAFRAVRYDPDVAGAGVETSAPAYDALDRLRYARHRTTNPYTVLELIAGEGGGSGADDFASARTTLDRWQRTGVLVEDPSSAMYLYEEHELRHGIPVVQRGIVAALDLRDIDDGHLVLHEHIDPHRADRRAQRLRMVPIDLTPVVALHVGGTTPDLRRVGADARRHAPTVAFSDEDGIDHRVWRIDDPRACRTIADAFADVHAVLADGHHRVAAALRTRNALRRQGRDPGGFTRTTAWIVDAVEDGPEIRAIHRAIHSRPAVDAAGDPLIEGFRALPWRSGVPELEAVLTSMSGLVMGLVTPDGAWVLRADEGVGRDDDLHVDVVERVLAPAMAVGAVVEPVVDIRDAMGRMAAGAGPLTLVLLRPPTAAQVLAMASAGQRMPAKSTWFRPKPRAGLVMRRLDDVAGTA